MNLGVPSIDGPPLPAFIINTNPPSGVPGLDGPPLPAYIINTTIWAILCASVVTNWDEFVDDSEHKPASGVDAEGRFFGVLAVVGNDSDGI